MILFHLHTRLSIDFRTDESRGGQLNFHNVSYIGSSFLTMVTRFCIVSMDPLERAGLMAIGTVVTIDDLFYWTHLRQDPETFTKGGLQ